MTYNAEKRSAHYQKYKETSAACTKVWRAANKERVQATRRAAHLRNLYGLSLEDYDEMFRKQNGACAICKETQKRKLHVDHNHNTGAVRSLLCMRCNTIVGYLESPLRDAALVYIKEHA